MEMQVVAKQVLATRFALCLTWLLPTFLVSGLPGPNAATAEVEPSLALILEECVEKLTPSGSYFCRFNSETGAQKIEAELWIGPDRVAVVGTARYKRSFSLSNPRRESLVGSFCAELSKKQQILYREDESLVILSDNEFLPSEIACYPSCWLWDPSLGDMLEFARRVFDSQNYEVTVSSDSSGRVLVVSRYRKRTIPESKMEFEFDRANRLVSYAYMPLGSIGREASPWYGAEFEWDALEGTGVDWVKCINQWRASGVEEKELVRRIGFRDFREAFVDEIPRVTTNRSKLQLGVKVLDIRNGVSRMWYSAKVGSEFEHGLRSRAFEIRKALGLFGGDPE